MTLVEVLVAVVVCGAGLALVSAGLSGAIRAEAYAADLDRAASHVQLLAARIDSGELELSDARGTFEAEGADDVSWEITTANADTDVSGLTSYTITIRWTRQGVQRDLSVERWVFVDPLVGGVQ